MDYSTGRALLQAAESSQDTAPFFGFIGAAAALVFSCEWRGRERGESRYIPIAQAPQGLFCSQRGRPHSSWTGAWMMLRGDRPAREAWLRAWLLARSVFIPIAAVCCASTFLLCRHGSCLWHSKVRCWYRIHGCHAARAGDEVHCASGHGWCAGYLRPDHCCDHQHRRWVWCGVPVSFSESSSSTAQPSSTGHTTQHMQPTKVPSLWWSATAELGSFES